MRTRKNILMAVALLTSILLTTVVYSSFQTKLQITGAAILRTPAEIRITNIRRIGTTGGASEVYSPTYGKDNISIYGKLPAESSLSYEVEITNIGSKDYIVSDIHELTNNNENVSITPGISVNNLVSRNDTKRFTITLTNSTTSEQTINYTNQYKFTVEEDPTIVMNDIPSSHTKGNDYPINSTYTVGVSGLKETSCKSNVSGVVTNLSTLATGTHTITCTVTANSGKTKSISKTTTITYVSYNITNMITNGSFENGLTGWSISTPLTAEIVTTNKLVGNNALKLTVKYSFTQNEQAYQTINTITNNIYYFTAYTNTHAESTNSLTRIVFSPSSSWDWLAHTSSTTIYPDTWRKHSVTYKNPSYTALKTRVAFGNNSAGNAAGDYYYIDSVVVVNLTATFGAGNEPTKEWCDENIKYFDGTITIYK